MGISTGEYLYHDFRQKPGENVNSTAAGVNDAKICPKIATKYNAVIQILLNLSTYSCVSQRKFF